MDYRTASIASIEAECKRLEQAAQVATQTRIQLGRSGASESEMRPIQQAEMAAESNANRCKAALARRRAGRQPDPSTLTEAKPSDFRTATTDPSLFNTVAGGSTIGDIFNNNPSATKCDQNRGKCLDRRKFPSAITGGVFVRGKCPGPAHIQCLTKPRRTGTATRRPTVDDAVDNAVAEAVAEAEAEVQPKRRLNFSGIAEVAKSPIALFLVPIGAAIAYKALT